MSKFRRHLLLSGLAGLLICALAAAISVWLVVSDAVKPLLPHPAMALLLAVVLGGFSVAEIPMMVFAMRRLAIERKGNYGFVLSLNALYVFFAVVYGLPVLLLTGSVGWGSALCGLSVVRFVASLMFVHEPPS